LLLLCHISDISIFFHASTLILLESWQSIGAVLDSKAALSSFCLELSKRMNIRYMSPPMPVDLTVKQEGEMRLARPDTISVRECTAETAGEASLDYSALAGMFDPSSPKL